MPYNLYIRADASSEIGMGHVMRCLALAQAWQDEGGTVIFLCSKLPEALEKRIKKENIEVRHIQAVIGASEDSKQTRLAISGSDRRCEDDSSWVVLDGYHFDYAYQHAMRSSGHQLLVIDDYNHLPAYECDILLNQNLGAEKYPYNVNTEATLLLGSKYVLLRREFRNVIAMRCLDHDVPMVGKNREKSSNNWKCRLTRFLGGVDKKRNRTHARPISAKNILITMGGADPHHITQEILQEIDKIEVGEIHLKVVVGGANIRISEIREQAEQLQCNAQVCRSVEDMAPLIQWADVVVTAAGSTCWEVMALGTSMVVIQVTENQAGIGEALANKGVAHYLGIWPLPKGMVKESLSRLLLDVELRQAMTQASFKSIDGHGAPRAISVLRGDSYFLRDVTRKDARFLLDLANQPDVRSMAVHPETISWDTHVAWFEERLNDPNHITWVVEDKEAQRIGYVRFDVHGSIAVISIALGEAHRGQGIGKLLVAQAIKKLIGRFSEIAIVQADVRRTNAASRGLFESLGFVADDTKTPPIGFFSYCLHPVVENKK